MMTCIHLAGDAQLCCSQSYRQTTEGQNKCRNVVNVEYLRLLRSLILLSGNLH